MAIGRAAAAVSPPSARCPVSDLVATMWTPVLLVLLLSAGLHAQLTLDREWTGQFLPSNGMSETAIPSTE